MIQLHRAIRKWHQARKAGAHPKFIKRLADNVNKLSEEKKNEAKTQDTSAGH